MLCKLVLRDLSRAKIRWDEARKSGVRWDIAEVKRQSQLDMNQNYSRWEESDRQAADFRS